MVGAVRIRFVVVLAATRIGLAPEDSGEDTGALSRLGDLGLPPPKGLRRERMPRLSGLESGFASRGGGLLGVASGLSTPPGSGTTGGRTTEISWGGFTTSSSGT